MQKQEESKPVPKQDGSLSETLYDALTTYPYAARVALASDLDNPDMSSSLVSFMSLFAGRDSNNNGTK